MALTDDLFQSIDTIISARIANLPYDQTIECEVTNNDDAADGIYKVKYQAAEFEATSTSTDYEVGDKVYVHIPQNDYKQDKIILNKKYINENDIAKTLPFLSFAKGTNYFTRIQQAKEVQISTTSDGAKVSNQIFELEPNTPIAGYTSLGFKFGISADIPFEMRSGDYGITITAIGYDQSKIIYSESEILQLSNLTEQRDFTLSIKDMIISNPYNTLGYCNQEKVFDITNFVIRKLKISIWQDGNFKASNGGNVAGRFIFFNNFQLYAGYPTSDFSKALTKLYLYTRDGLSYSVESLTKTIYSRLVKLDTSTNNLSEVFIPSNYYKYIWEHYVPGSRSMSSVSNLGQYETIEGKTSSSLEKYELSGNRNNAEQKIVLTIQHKVQETQKYISNELKFINQAYIANSEILDLLTGLSVSINSNNQGIYAIYGEDNYSTNPLISDAEQTFELTFSPLSGDPEKMGFLVGDIITWRMPGTNTMIRPPRLNREYTAANPPRQDPSTGEYIFERVISKKSEIELISFYIKDYYVPSYNNNTFYFTLKRDAEEYSTSFPLTFMTSNINGNEYSIVPTLYEIGVNGTNVETNCFNLGKFKDNPKYQIKYAIYDFSNNLIADQQVAGIDYSNLINLTVNDGIISFSGETALSPERYYGHIVINTTLGINQEQKTITHNYVIPVVSNEQNYSKVNAPDIITFDITGKKPYYKKNKIEIKGYNDIQWQLGYFDYEKTFHDSPLLTLQGWPEIKDNTLKVASIFHEALLNYKFILYGKNNNGQVVWARPIIFIANKYISPSQNDDSISTGINEIGDQIIDCMVGRIEQQNINNDLNSYDNPSGAFIGTIYDAIKANTNHFGFFGYNAGERTFEINNIGQVTLNGGSNGSVNIFNSCIEDSSITDTNLFLDNNNNLIIKKDNTELFNLSDGSLVVKGSVTSTTFNGALNGNAKTATSADSAKRSTTAQYAVTAAGYDTTQGLINTRLEAIKTAIQTLAEKHSDVTITLW